MITVAIPFYNTIEYIESCLDSLIDSDYVDEVVISDDCSDYVIEIDHPKVKIFRNLTNKGAFRNKYLSIFRSSNEWVYLLDSDNYLSETSIDSMRNIDNLNPDTYYSPFQLNLVNEDLDQSLDGKKITYNFPDKRIGLDQAQKYLETNIPYFDWFLNTGNFLVNKKTYLESMKFIFDNNQHQHLEADAIAFTTYWLLGGNFIEIIPNFSYNHRVRTKSYSHAFGSKNAESISYHKNLILES